MSELSITNLSSFYGKHAVLNNINLSLKKGEIGCLLGPSGCGKTTLLRCIAGLQNVSHGSIKLKECLLSSSKQQLPTEKRNIGMIFQDHALFPHMTIKQNIAFGISNLNQQQQQHRVKELLTIINLLDLENRYPHQLSGGQQQRIALARALAPKPEILLMDEPFSSLDKDLRENLTKEVRGILKAENITSLMVTHDQNEAFSIADSIGVMQKGSLLQWDDSFKLYHQPKHPFVANFIGPGMFIKGIIVEKQKAKTSLGLLNIQATFTTKKDSEVSILVRPDDIIHDDNSDFKLEIIHREFRGYHYILTLKLNNNEQIMCLSQSHHNHPVGEKIGIKVDIEHAIGFRHSLQK